MFTAFAFAAKVRQSEASEGLSGRRELLSHSVLGLRELVGFFVSIAGGCPIGREDRHRAVDATHDLWDLRTVPVGLLLPCCVGILVPRWHGAEFLLPEIGLTVASASVLRLRLRSCLMGDGTGNPIVVAPIHGRSSRPRSTHDLIVLRIKTVANLSPPKIIVVLLLMLLILL